MSVHSTNAHLRERAVQAQKLITATHWAYLDWSPIEDFSEYHY